MLVLLQLFLSQSEDLFTHQRRHRHFDPLLPWSLMVGAVAAGDSVALPQRPGDSLPRTQLRLAIAGLAAISRIAQHAPHCRSLPTRRCRSRRNLALVQHASNGVDAQPLLRICFKHHPHNISLDFDHFIVGRRTLALANIVVSIGSAGQHVDHPLLGPMTFSTPAALGNLRAFVLGDHALELHHQLIFRCCSSGRLQKNQLYAATRKLFDQKNLIGIFAAQPVRGVDQRRSDLAFGCKVTQSFQARSRQNRATVTFILKNPLRRHGVTVCGRVVQKSCRLAGNRVILLLAVRRDPSVNGRCFVHRLSPRVVRCIRALWL